MTTTTLLNYIPFERKKTRFDDDNMIFLCENESFAIIHIHRIRIERNLRHVKHCK